MQQTHSKCRPSQCSKRTTPPVWPGALLSGCTQQALKQESPELCRGWVWLPCPYSQLCAQGVISGKGAQ